MLKIRTSLFLFSLLFCLSCTKYADDKEYFFISSTCELIRENERIVNMDSVFVDRFILKAPYSHYTILLNDSSAKEDLSNQENRNPFLMFRFSVLDSSAEDIAISDLNLHLFKLYDSIPGDKIEIHGISTGNLNKPIYPSDVVGKIFSNKDTIKIKAGTTNPVVFMVTDYDLKDNSEDATFLLRTQMTIKYRNAYNIV